jgi:LuxR family maltose regulon positive regulatory protein
MPKPSLHLLRWSEERQSYELSTQGQLQRRFCRDDEQPWQEWLSEQRSFAFQGQHGHVSVIKEVRQRGGGYWYVYRSSGQRTMKRYLGQTSRVTLARLEEVVLALTGENASDVQTKPAHIQEPPASAYEVHKNRVPLLETKLFHPRLPSALVKRERLLRALDTVLEHRLLLLSASAGSGKTTLLSAWVAQSSHNIGWLSLDEFDNDPTRFWGAVIEVLHTCLPRIGELALAMLYTAQPTPLPIVLTTLINEILGCASEIILILDDYHVIEDPLIQQTMLFLLDHLPANLHLIIASRVDPPLPLARWRMRGQMGELREREIRFTQEEAHDFLCQGMRLSLTKEEVELLESRTEGWIAGLQLAALSIRTQNNPSTSVQRFSGDQHFILDYVQEEIFQHQPLPVQQFLLRVAILSRMNAALCQALTEESASREMLETLERNNLFVVSLDEQRHWYRLHALFREVLLARLQATQPELMPDLHQRAARWYATHDLIHEAMTHALAAKDYAFALSAMEQAAGQLWMQGEAKLIATWIVMLSDVIVGAYLAFALTAVLKLLSRTQSMPEEQRVQALAQSEQIIVHVELALQREEALSPAEERRLYNRIRLVRGYMGMNEAFRKGNMPQVRYIAQQMQPLAVDEPVAWRWPALYGLFVSVQLMGDAVLLLPDLLAIKQQAFQEQDRATSLVAMCWIAAAFLYGGKLRLLQQECLQVQDLLRQSGEHVAIAAYPAFDLASLYYARNELEQAEASLQEAMQQAERWQDMNLLVWSYAVCVKVFLAAGKVEEAEEALQQAQNLMQRSGFSVYEPDVMAAQVALWLAQGNLSAAEIWARQYRFHPEALEYMRQEEYLALARVYLEQQCYEQCLQLLAPLLSRMEQLERTWDVIHLLALQIVASYKMGEMVQARQSTVRLLTLTELEGYIRVYLDGGEPMKRVLQNLRDTPYTDEAPLSTAHVASISTLLAAFAQEERWHFLRESGVNEPASPRLSAGQREIYEPLSPQEQRVLSLLVAGRTYAEIAQELIVSTNTIKTQVSSIYRKLGVSRRAEASTVARQLHLL